MEKDNCKPTNFITMIIPKIDMIYYKLYCVLMAVGILCHGFMLFNKISNHDDVVALTNKGTTYKLGRWFLETTGIISGMFSIPLFIGVFSITMIILSGFFICNILEIKKPGRILAVGAIMVCFPTVAGTFSFMFTADSYFLAMLVSCMGVWSAVKRPVKLGGVLANDILAIILLALGLGIYQAYYSVALTLAMLYGILLFIRNTTQKFIQKFINLIVVLGAGMLLYLVINHFVLAATGNDFNTTSVSEVISVIPHAILMSYKNIWFLFTSDLCGLSYGRILQFCWILAVTGMCMLLFILSVKKKRNLLIAAGFALALPLCVNFMRFFMNSREMDTLIMYAYVLLLVAPVFLTGELEQIVEKRVSFGFLMNFARTVYLVTVLVFVWRYTIQANRFYVGMDIVKTEAVSYYTTLISQIKSTEGYRGDMEICLLGTNSQDKTLTNFNPYTAAIRGSLTLKEVVAMYSREGFLNIYCGFSAKYKRKEEMESMKEVLEMPCYPDYGSIKIINDVVVIKIK